MAAAKSERAKQKLEDRLLTCSVCLDRYTDPRILPCHHCFCNDCIVPLPRVLCNVGHMHINCLLCKMSMPVPDNGVFPPAFYINSLMEITEQYMAITPVSNKPMPPSGNRQSMPSAGPLMNTSRPLLPPRAPAHNGNSIASAGLLITSLPLPPPPPPRTQLSQAGPPPPPPPPPPRTQLSQAGCPLPPPPLPSRTQLRQASLPLLPSSSNSDRPHLGPPVPPKGNKGITLISNDKSCGGPPPLPPKPASSGIQPLSALFQPPLPPPRGNVTSGIDFEISDEH